MAIDTRERRASAGACGLLGLVIPPIPDGTIGAGDRLQLLGMYAGILTAESEPPPSPAMPQTPIATFIDVESPIAELL